MKVKQAMHKTVEWKSPDTSLNEIAQVMKKNDIGAVPIGENDRLVGMVTDRDIVIRGLTNGSDMSTLCARDVMTKGVIFCKEEDSVEDAAELMSQKKVRRLPVLNEKKRMVGIVSLGDISHTASKPVTADLAKAVSAHH